MESVEAPELTVVRPGEGETPRSGTIGVVFKLFGEQTNGNVSIVEHPFPVGACVPPHLHTREDEYSIVTEGRSASGPATARSSWEPAATSPSPAVRRTPCGTRGLFQPG